MVARYIIARFTSALAVVVLLLAIPALARTADAPPDITKLLANVLEGKTSFKSVYLEIYINRQPGILENIPACSTQIYGGGTGVWDGGTQYTLTEKEVRALIEQFRDQNFTQLPETIGETGMDPRLARPILVSSRITLRIGQTTKSVSQLPFGDQSKAFAAIAREAQRTSAAAVKRTGVACDDLGRGLAMVANGQLRPEVFSGQCLTYVPGVDGSNGWQLVWAGGALQANDIRGGAAKDHRRMDATPEQIAALVKALQEEGFDRMPLYIHYPGSVDFNAYVLKGRNAVQGKSFEVYKQKATPEDEKRLVRLLGRLKTIHGEVMKSGHPIPTPNESGDSMMPLVVLCAMLVPANDAGPRGETNVRAQGDWPFLAPFTTAWSQGRRELAIRTPGELTQRWESRAWP